MSMITFTGAQESDLRAIAALDERAFDFPWSFADFAGSWRAGHQFIVIKDDDQMVGYAVYMSIFENAELLTIAVDPPFQGKGYGRVLLTELCSRLASCGIENLFLEVRPSNTAALSLYRKFGFEEISRRKDYYPTHGGREDAIVMCKRLP